MDLEGIMLSEISQAEKDKHYMIPCVDSKKAKLIETELGWRFARGWETGQWERLVRRFKLSAMR